MDHRHRRNVVRTRLKDMEQMMNTDQHQQKYQSSLCDPVLLDSDEGVIEEVKP
ncbi:hypothetical protein IMY05_015G0116700 [Salix suchowensis]|nr:hypothetical protein IMY05_015G0116700 [Salix suchowensis]